MGIYLGTPRGRYKMASIHTQPIYLHWTNRDPFIPFLKSDQWRCELADHPDRAYVDYLLRGISQGFRIGYNRSHILQPSRANLPSGNPEVIVDYLKREVALGRMMVCPSRTGIHVSPMGVIPKKNRPGKWRLIVDLSAPEGGSVNDRISREQSTLPYSSVDHLSALVLSRGRGAHLVNADVKEAYRTVPVHEDDQPLLGISWQGVTYVNRVLPFGLRSAPKIFTAIADATLTPLDKHSLVVK